MCTLGWWKKNEEQSIAFSDLARLLNHLLTPLFLILYSFHSGTFPVRSRETNAIPSSPGVCWLGHTARFHCSQFGHTYLVNDTCNSTFLLLTPPKQLYLKYRCCRLLFYYWLERKECQPYFRTKITFMTLYICYRKEQKMWTKLKFSYHVSCWSWWAHFVILILILNSEYKELFV